MKLGDIVSLGDIHFVIDGIIFWYCDNCEDVHVKDNDLYDYIDDCVSF